MCLPLHFKFYLREVYIWKSTHTRLSNEAHRKLFFLILNLSDESFLSIWTLAFLTSTPILAAGYLFLATFFLTSGFPITWQFSCDSVLRYPLGTWMQLFLRTWQRFYPDTCHSLAAPLPRHLQGLTGRFPQEPSLQWVDFTSSLLWLWRPDTVNISEEFYHEQWHIIISMNHIL